MLEKVFGSQIDDLQNALTRTTQRQALLTTNLANANVPGYKRKDIDFHVALESQFGGATKAELDRQNAEAQALSDQTSIRSDGNNVDEEREMTGMAETDLHFQALTQMTSDFFSGLKNVIREGK
ncbi:MAG TPA: flagellar basal body rod protein FlgB [Fimbriimonas sp.]|nr:flagellar basal body rod protein FlgB [Fimbriimonas sp.]